MPVPAPAPEGARELRAPQGPHAPFVLPDACDNGPAMALDARGFPAIGTTSLGVAAAAGCRTVRRRHAS